MKTIIISFLLVLAFSSKITFEKDSNEASPISILTKGFFDASVSGEAKISAFLRLANELIPLAEMTGPAADPAAKKLGFYRPFCYGQLGDMFSGCLNFNAGLYIGWTVTQGSSAYSSGAPLYNITYVPFVRLAGQVNVSVSSYPAQVSYGLTLQIVNVQVPTYLAIGQQAVCYSSMLNFQPGAIYTSVNTALLQCAWYVTPL